MQRHRLKIAVKYILIVIIAAFVSSGAVIAVFLHTGDTIGHKILFTLLPRAGLFCIVSIINICYAIPRLILHNRFAAYSVLMFLLSSLPVAVSVIIEHALKIGMGIETEGIRYGAPWLWLYIISYGTLTFILMLGMGAYALFMQLREDAMTEQKLSASYRGNIEILRSRLDSLYIFAMLDEISTLLHSSVSDATERLQALSDYLRQQLYGFTHTFTPSATSNLPASTGFLFGPVAGFITSRRYRVHRHIAMELLVLIVAIGAYFPCSHINFAFQDALGCIIAIALLNGLVYINHSILFPYYSRCNDMTGYVRFVGIAILIPGIIGLISNFCTFSSLHSYSSLMTFIAVLSSFGTMVSLGLFVGGVAAMLSLKHWLQSRISIMLLNVENTRLEYAFLKKQINPHFLFNILNSIDILAEENIEEALNVLAELKEILRFQFADSRRPFTTVGREIEFLNNYLSLEKHRFGNLHYEIVSDKELEEIEIPTLMLIPFVENAVKHSADEDVLLIRRICLSFTRSGSNFIFACSNTYSANHPQSTDTGGLGLANISRRIHLQYGDSCRLHTHVTDSVYHVSLTIPIAASFDNRLFHDRYATL